VAAVHERYPNIRIAFGKSGVGMWGLRLPAWRRRLAGIGQIHRRAIGYLPPAMTHKIARDNAGKFPRVDRLTRMTAAIKHAVPMR